MSPADNVFWLGFGMGALAALVGVTIIAVINSLRAMVRAPIQPFTGEQHDGRP